MGYIKHDSVVIPTKHIITLIDGVTAQSLKCDLANVPNDARFVMVKTIYGEYPFLEFEESNDSK